MSVPTLASLPAPAPARGTTGPSGARRNPSSEDAGAAGDFAAALETARSGPTGTDEGVVDDPSTGDVEATTAAVVDDGATTVAPAVPVIVPGVRMPTVQPSPASPAPEQVSPAPATALPAPVPVPAPVLAPATVVPVPVPAGAAVVAAVDPVMATVGVEPVVSQAAPSDAATPQPIAGQVGAAADEGAKGSGTHDGQGTQPGPPAAETPTGVPVTDTTAPTSAAATPQEAQPVSQSTPVTSAGAALPAAALRTLDGGPAPAAPVVPHPQVPAPLATQLAPRVGGLRSLGEGVHRLVMRVQPEEIGSVRVVAEITSDRVRIELHGGTEQAREALRAALPDLRRDLLGTDPPGARAELDLGSAGRHGGRDRDRPGDPRRAVRRRRTARAGAARAAACRGRACGRRDMSRTNAIRHPSGLSRRAYVPTTPQDDRGGRPRRRRTACRSTA